MVAAGELAKLFERLEQWEGRRDHDTGPDLSLNQAWLMMFADGSGQVVVELGMIPGNPEMPDDIRRLFTTIGLKGMVEKRFSFTSINEAIEIVSRPLCVDWRR